MRAARRTITFGVGNIRKIIGEQSPLKFRSLHVDIERGRTDLPLATSGEIIVSEPFYKRLGTPPAVEELQAINLKGKAEEVRIYRVKR